MDILINLLSGAVGGNLLGMLSKGRGIISTLLGLIGGGAGHQFGAQILEKLGDMAEPGQGALAGVSAGLGGLLSLIGGFFQKKKQG